MALLWRCEVQKARRPTVCSNAFTDFMERDTFWNLGSSEAPFPLSVWLQNSDDFRRQAGQIKRQRQEPMRSSEDMVTQKGDILLTGDQVQILMFTILCQARWIRLPPELSPHASSLQQKLTQHCKAIITQLKSKTEIIKVKKRKPPYPTFSCLLSPIEKAAASPRIEHPGKSKHKKCKGPGSPGVSYLLENVHLWGVQGGTQRCARVSNTH